MASVVLGVVGGVIGSFFGMPQLGYALGSALGSALDPQKLPDQVGPRISDLKVTTSTYGIALPRVYGTIRLAGNIIASSPLIEHQNKTTQGGKGGPTQTSTTYTYTQHFAIALCEGQIQGIKRIWANGTLIYNISDGSDISTILASNKIADSISVYYGTSDQMPDSLIQSLVGVDKTPAFRDTAYVVFNNFQLSNFGNRTPNLEFEVVSYGSSTYNINTAYSFPLSLLNGNYHIVNAPGTYGRRSQEYVYNNIVLNTPNQICYVTVYKTESDYTNNKKSYLIYNSFYNNTGSLITELLPTDYDLTFRDMIKTHKSYDSSCIVGGFNNSTLSFNIIVGFSNGQKTDITQYFPAGSYGQNFMLGLLSTVNLSVKNSRYMYLVNQADGASFPTDILRLDCSGQAISNPLFKASVFPVDPARIVRDIDLNDLNVYIIYGFGVVYKYDFDLNFISIISVPVRCAQIACSGDKVFVIGSNETGDTNTKIYEITSGTAVLVANLNQFVPIGWLDPDVYNNQFGGSKFFYDNNNFYYQNRSPFASDSNSLHIISRHLSSENIPLSEVITDLVTLSGELDASKIDVTSLANDYVNGYVIANRMTCRNTIEPLMQTYFFDTIETDGKLHFIKRGLNTSIQILEDDLSASTYGSALPDQLKIDRKQSLDLLQEVNVSYLDYEANYNIGTQYSRRLIGKNVNSSTLQLPMSLNSDKAKQISDVLLYNSWQERTSFSFSLSNKYLYLNPTDVIDVTKDGITYNVRIIDTDYQNNIINVSAVEEDQTIYSQNSIGSSVPIAPNANTDGSITVIGSTNFKMLDIPILRDSDDLIGYYVAATGFNSGWTGCQPFKSIDNGASFSSFGTAILNSSTIGNTLTALGNFNSGDIFDELNTVNVLVNAQLNSTTELAVLNGSNIALIGNEIIQFKNASLIAENTYQLSGLLRGKFGTEREMNNHIINDLFIILSSDTIYIETSPSSEYGLERDYKAVTLGQNLDDALDINFTNNAIAQKPYSPVKVSGGRDASGNATLTWIRRTRISGGWNNLTDVPVGESTESYSVDIMNGSTVVRTINVSNAQTVAYSAANQTSDFGSPQSSITYNVYQISASIGRGFAGTGTF